MKNLVSNIAFSILVILISGSLFNHLSQQTSLFEQDEKICRTLIKDLKESRSQLSRIVAENGVERFINSLQPSVKRIDEITEEFIRLDDKYKGKFKGVERDLSQIGPRLADDRLLFTEGARQVKDGTEEIKNYYFNTRSYRQKACTSDKPEIAKRAADWAISDYKKALSRFRIMNQTFGNMKSRMKFYDSLDRIAAIGNEYRSEGNSLDDEILKIKSELRSRLSEFKRIQKNVIDEKSAAERRSTNLKWRVRWHRNKKPNLDHYLETSNNILREIADYAKPYENVDLEDYNRKSAYFAPFRSAISNPGKYPILESYYDFIVWGGPSRLIPLRRIFKSTSDRGGQAKKMMYEAKRFAAEARDCAKKLINETGLSAEDPFLGCVLTGSWVRELPGTNDLPKGPSTYTFSRSKTIRGKYDVKEHGHGNATGTATITGSYSLKIRWKTGSWVGTEDWKFKPDCSAATGTWRVIKGRREGPASQSLTVNKAIN